MEGETKNSKRGGGQAWSRGGYLKKGELEPPYELCLDKQKNYFQKALNIQQFVFSEDAQKSKTFNLKQQLITDATDRLVYWKVMKVKILSHLPLGSTHVVPL